MDPYPKQIDRQPVAAGRFYSAHAEKLELEIEKMFLNAEKEIKIKLPSANDLLALIAPHAGYVYSGIVSASAFLQLKHLNPRKRIFLIGSSHHTDFNGASIYNVGNYLTPFGHVEVDKVLADNLIEQSPIIEFVQAAHAHEHGLEVMLPFIQYFWKNEFKIVPIVIATHRNDICKQLADLLMPYFNTQNLFVFSTDLSHYPDYDNAVKIDKQTTQAILKADSQFFLEQINKHKSLNIPNLATSICGWTSILTLLYIMEEQKNDNIHSILYQNSGDAKLYGEKDRVVGYQSMAIYKNQKENQFTLSEDEKQQLLALAKKSIKHYAESGTKLVPKPDEYSSNNIIQKRGAFVSVYEKDELRGCIGRISTPASLFETIAELAVSATFFDTRFSPISKNLLDEIQIEISVLTPLKRISSPDEIILGKHGIYIKKGAHSGTFLPQVGERSDWTNEEFLGHCAKNKARIGWDGWKDAELFTYEAIIFKS